METKIVWGLLLLLLHHRRCSSAGPHHDSWTTLKPAVVSLILEKHGRSDVHAMRA